MTPTDWIKLAVILPLFLGVGPLLGVAAAGRPAWQRWMFAAMCFMTVNGLFSAGNWGLTLASVETYRGHAKGYHFYFNQVLAIALMVAAWKGNPPARRRLPPGTGVYLLFVGACMLSIPGAPRPDYAWMAAHKMLLFPVVAIAAYHWVRGTGELAFFLRVMAGTMCVQAGVVLKMKYLDGIYQVRGTFEHQNPLAMYALMIAMPLLAAALGPAFRGRGLCTAGYAACAVIMQAALSRAALLLFAAGTVAVVLGSLVERPTRRRWGMLAGLGLGAAVGLAFTLDTIVARFNDHGNTASGELRDVLNEAARRMEADHPLGIGWNHYALCINPPFPYADVVHDWIRGRGMKVDESKPNAPVESHYYLLLAENGKGGLLAWLLVIGLGLWWNLRALLAFPHGLERCVSLGLLAGCGLNYLQSALERVLTQPRNLMLWLILAGITARLETMRRAGGPAASDGAAAPPPSPTPTSPRLPWPGRRADG